MDSKQSAVSTESVMALFSECGLKCPENIVDIVREGIYLPQQRAAAQVSISKSLSDSL